jgi:hypothetical protein
MIPIEKKSPCSGLEVLTVVVHCSSGLAAVMPERDVPEVAAGHVHHGAARNVSPVQRTHGPTSSGRD